MTTMTTIDKLNALVDLSALINSTLDIGEIRKRTIEAAAKLVDSSAGSLLLVNEITGDLYFDVALGDKAEHVQGLELKRDQGIAGWVATHQEPVIVNDATQDTRIFRNVDQVSGFTTHNLICVPVCIKNKLAGVLQAINKHNPPFNEEDLRILMALANHVAVAVENARLHEELRHTFHSTVHALAEAMEMKDPYTAGHTRRVTAYSLAIGRQLKLSLQDMTALKLAAILHDVGMIGIRDELLHKGSPSQSDELSLIQAHVEHGEHILRHLKPLKRPLLGVKYHHAHYDGSGYPPSAQGDKIPLLGRIIAVADQFDSLIHHRPYGKMTGTKKALEELDKLAGKQLDPALVQAFRVAYKKYDLDKIG